MLNKKGEKVISIYWFVILFIVAGAIVYIVLIYYGNFKDVRELEANALANKIAECVSEGGYIKEGILSREDFKNSFLEKCGLNFNVEKSHGWKNDQYYTEVNFYDFDVNSGSMDEIRSVSTGNVNLKGNCGGGKNPVCVERMFYSLTSDSEVAIKILAVVRKTEKND